jgi:hypothetical protein
MMEKSPPDQTERGSEPRRRSPNPEEKGMLALQAISAAMPA